MSTVLTQQLPVGTWTLDRVHSEVGFAVRHMVVSTFRGGFEDYDVTLTVEEDGSASLVGVVRTAGVVVKDPNLAAHLRSPEFFDSETYPEIRFVSTSLRHEGGRFVADGELTVRGVTKPVTATGTISEPTVDAFGGTRLGLELETVVDRTAFGLSWNAPLPKGGVALANDVRLVAAVELTLSA